LRSRILFLFLTSLPAAAQAPARPQWVTSLQTGMADTFQLTLGGMFGEGPAWQTKVTTGVANLFKSGDSLSVYGWNTFDSRSQINSYQAGIGYKRPVWRRGAQSLALGSGFQHWHFPTVKSGSHDWLIPGNLQYTGRAWRVPMLVTSDSWTLVKSPLPTGSLVHTQVWARHRLFRNDAVQVELRHGPAHTYSWNFYGTQGNRVFRYQSMVVLTAGAWTVDGGFRKQVGLQDGIQNNNYWQFSVTRTFVR
jgi:hypothetical protein